MKPCPFCGYPAEEHAKEPAMYHCSNIACGGFDACWDEKEWNTRQIDPMADKLVNALKEVQTFFYTPLGTKESIDKTRRIVDSVISEYDKSNPG